MFSFVYASSFSAHVTTKGQVSLDHTRHESQCHGSRFPLAELLNMLCSSPQDICLGNKIIICVIQQTGNISIDSQHKQTSLLTITHTGLTKLALTLVFSKPTIQDYIILLLQIVAVNNRTAVLVAMIEITEYTDSVPRDVLYMCYKSLRNHPTEPWQIL